MEEATPTPEKTWITFVLDHLNRLDSLERRIEVLEKHVIETSAENTVKRIRQQVDGKL
jgi:hypothetical protein